MDGVVNTLWMSLLVGSLIWRHTLVLVNLINATFADTAVMKITSSEAYLLFPETVQK